MKLRFEITTKKQLDNVLEITCSCKRSRILSVLLGDLGTNLYGTQILNALQLNLVPRVLEIAELFSGNLIHSESFLLDSLYVKLYIGFWKEDEQSNQASQKNKQNCTDCKDAILKQLGRETEVSIKSN